MFIKLPTQIGRWTSSAYFPLTFCEVKVLFVCLLSTSKIIGCPLIESSTPSFFLMSVASLLSEPLISPVLNSSSSDLLRGLADGLADVLAEPLALVKTRSSLTLFGSYCREICLSNLLLLPSYCSCASLIVLSMLVLKAILL